MRVPCAECRLRQEPFFRAFTGDELQSVAKLKSSHLAVPAKTDIVRADEVGGGLYTLYEGWAFRYRVFPGGARQIFDLVLPGDLIGLAAVLHGTTRHSVQTLTPASFCVLEGYPFIDLLSKHPQLVLSLLRWRVEEEQRADQLAALLGRRTPLQRLGYLVLETFDRLRQRELANATICPFPLQRRHLADFAGLSMIHLNRTLTQLRQEKLAVIEDRTLVIFDRKRLTELSGYQAGRLLPQHPLI